MIIDSHSHILPGIDDGSRSMEETRAMLKIAFREGIDGIITTPHFSGDITAEMIDRRNSIYESVCSVARELNPNAELYTGNEIFYSEDTLEALENGRALTLNHTRYVLVEFPEYAEFSYIRQAVQELQYGGYIPVLAHIERYKGAREEENVARLVEMGACMQTNAYSVIGKYGWATRHYILKLMKKRLIHIVATDAHRADHRTPRIRECLACIDKKIGKSYRREISEKNPLKIIRGEYISG